MRVMWAAAARSTLAPMHMTSAPWVQWCEAEDEHPGTRATSAMTLSSAAVSGPSHRLPVAQLLIGDVGVRRCAGTAPTV